jgi:hypothetical protein
LSFSSDLLHVEKRSVHLGELHEVLLGVLRSVENELTVNMKTSEYAAVATVLFLLVGRRESIEEP